MRINRLLDETYVEPSDLLSLLDRGQVIWSYDLSPCYGDGKSGQCAMALINLKRKNVTSPIFSHDFEDLLRYVSENTLLVENAILARYLSKVTREVDLDRSDRLSNMEKIYLVLSEDERIKYLSDRNLINLIDLLYEKYEYFLHSMEDN